LSENEEEEVRRKSFLPVPHFVLRWQSGALSGFAINRRLGVRGKRRERGSERPVDCDDDR
jgi:hypothetical protein